MSETDTTPHTPKRERSPSYPGINLETALRRARQLYDAEKRNAAPIDVILSDWGYSPGSGAGLVAVAALKKFGLLADEGSGKQRKGRLTNLALSILRDPNEESVERDQLIRQAALMPRIHREVWEEYKGDIPSDGTLQKFLRFEKGFTDPASDDLIKEFRQTVAFAKLSPSDTLSGENGDSDEGAADDEGEAFVTASPLDTETPGQRSAPPAIQLRVDGRTVTLRESEPLTGAQWDQMLEVLKMQRPADE